VPRRRPGASRSAAPAGGWDHLTPRRGEGYVGFANPGGSPVTLTFAAPVAARYLRLLATRLGPDDFGNHYLQLAEVQPLLVP
jgi:hypothetical protein